jgi:hypothetical protein
VSLVEELFKKVVTLAKTKMVFKSRRLPFTDTVEEDRLEHLLDGKDWSEIEFGDEVDYSKFLLLNDLELCKLFPAILLRSISTFYDYQFARYLLNSSDVNEHLIEMYGAETMEDVLNLYSQYCAMADSTDSLL